MPSLKRKTLNWILTPATELIHQYQQLTWHNRALPDFIIIGAQKSGTSSLYNYLSKHPQLIASSKKEVHFFDGGMTPEIDNFKKGEAWYRSHFPLIEQVGNCKTYEASPIYLFNPLVPPRIADLLPQVKLIVMLRNPTERAISHYFHVKRNGCESLSLMEALLQEEQRLESIISDRECPCFTDRDYKNNAFIRYSYKSRGLYKQQLQRFLAYFSLQQMLILNSEEFFSHSTEILQQIFEFVGVDPFEIQDLKPRNVASNRSKVKPEVYSYLNDYFRPHNQELYDLLGKDYQW